MNSNSENFDQELKQHIEETGAKVLLECVAGDIGGGIMRLMPSHSVMITYGILSKDTLNNIDPMTFMYGQQTIEGFILDKYLLGKGLLGVLKVLNKTKKLLSTTLHSEVHGKFEFS